MTTDKHVQNANARRKRSTDERKAHAKDLIEKTRAAGTTITREVLRQRTGIGHAALTEVIRECGAGVVDRS